jgi:LAS superfamily LD-carboxypeptidase LdcB
MKRFSPTYIIVIILFLITVSGYLIVQKNKIQEEGLQVQEELKAELNRTQEDLASTNNLLVETIADRDHIQQRFLDEQVRVNTLASQVTEIGGTVGILEKIQRTDPELLQKYSKVYFLNEHYSPERLAQIGKQYNYDKARDFFIHADIKFFLESMMKAAGQAGVDLKIVSAYRSFGTQGGLKALYTVVYGSGANQFSADQGYSEHQLGTTVDLTDSDVGSDLLGFENSPVYEWLLVNAHKYGFVLSYPEDNTYYEFEPWHWRFVGRKLAQALHAGNIYFYDMDQREIDTYLVNFFD